MRKIGLGILLILAVQWIHAETEANFRVQATIEKGCQLNKAEQRLDFGRHPFVGQGQLKTSVINSTQTWNIKCTAQLPVKIFLDSGAYFSNNSRRMKHEQKDEFVPYQLYQDSSLQRVYERASIYSLTPTTAANSLLDFSIHAVADLNNNNQLRSVGLYKDKVVISITW